MRAGCWCVRCRCRSFGRRRGRGGPGGTARGLQAVSRTVQQLLTVGRVAANSGLAIVVALLSAYSIVYYLPHAVDRRMDYGALNNGRRLVMPFVDTTLAGPRLARVEPPAAAVPAGGRGSGTRPEGGATE